MTERMIRVGESLPAVKLQMMQAGRVVTVAANELFAGQRAVLFAVPAAFSPNCSEQHLPGYVNTLFEFRQKGIERLFCLAVNDVFVLQAWARERDLVDEVTMLADGNGDFTRAIGMEMDMRRFGLGLRSRRYAMVIDKGRVSHLLVEKQGGEVKRSRAEKVLEALEHA